MAGCKGFQANQDITQSVKPAHSCLVIGFPIYFLYFVAFNLGIFSDNTGVGFDY
jgi:hypothetical protein